MENGKALGQAPGRNRREFCAGSLRAIGGFTLLGGAGTLLSACGGDDEATGESSGGDGEIGSPRFAMSTGIIPIFVQQSAGPLLYGKEFGLNITPDHLIAFESHSVATQTVLSGDAEIISGSTSGMLAAVSQGIPCKFFCAARNRDDNVLVGRGPAKELTDILDENVRVAADSKGGAAYTELQAVLNTELDEPVAVGSLPGFTALESSSQREAALAAGQVDAAWMHIDQFWRLEEEIADARVLARSVDTPKWPLSGYGAMTEWLDQNQATATAIMESVRACSQAFVDDFKNYKEAVDELIDEPPPDKQLRELWEFAVENEIWPTDGGIVTQEAYDIIAELSESSEIVIEAPSFDEAVDTRPGEAL